MTDKPKDFQQVLDNARFAYKEEAVSARNAEQLAVKLATDAARNEYYRRIGIAEKILDDAEKVFDAALDARNGEVTEP